MCREIKYSVKKLMLTLFCFLLLKQVLFCIKTTTKPFHVRHQDAQAPDLQLIVLLC